TALVKTKPAGTGPTGSNGEKSRAALRADHHGSAAPADHVAVVIVDRHARPIASWPRHGGGVAGIDDVARIGPRKRAADDRAAEQSGGERSAAAGGGWSGRCRKRHGNRRCREQGSESLLHQSLLERRLTAGRGKGSSERIAPNEPGPRSSRPRSSRLICRNY